MNKNKLWLGAVLGSLFVLGLGYCLVKKSERAIERAMQRISE